MGVEPVQHAGVVYQLEHRPARQLSWQRALPAGLLVRQVERSGLQLQSQVRLPAGSSVAVATAQPSLAKPATAVALTVAAAAVAQLTARRCMGAQWPRRVVRRGL